MKYLPFTGNSRTATPTSGRMPIGPHDDAQTVRRVEDLPTPPGAGRGAAPPLPPPSYKKRATKFLSKATTNICYMMLLPRHETKD